MSEIPSDIMKAALNWWATMPAESAGIEHMAKAMLAARPKPEVRPHLRDCPFCHADGGNDEKIYLTKIVAIAKDCEFETCYSVVCTECGVKVDGEYKDEVVDRWNGTAGPAGEDD